MKLTLLRPIALAVCALSVSGCSMSGNSSYATQDLSGNWEFSTLYPGGIAPQNIVYTGALSGQGASITGVFRANRCFAATQDIAFTGTEDAKGNLTLTSTNLANNVVTITGMISSSSTGGTSVPSANLLIAGASPCAPVNTSFFGSLIPSATGNFAGSLSAAPGTTANFTAALSQGTANSDGQFPLSGTIAVSSPACGNTFPLATVYAGDSFTANLVSTSGPGSTAILTAGPVTSGTAPLLANFNIAIIGCNAGTFTGSLNKQ